MYELVREMLESERPPRAWYIVMPDTRLKMMWDLLILLLVFVSAFSIPAGISYAAIMGPELASALDAFDWVMVGIFAVDMVLNFAVAFQDRDGAWVRAARRRYGPLSDPTPLSHTPPHLPHTCRRSQILPGCRRPAC